MRNPTYTLTVNLPNDHVLRAMFPISRGPYMGVDLLLLMDDLCGNNYVVRATLDGKHLSTSEKVLGKDGIALVEKMLTDQSNKNCNAVTGGGRWGCE
jgi:hypothetical protein